ncbi:MAG: hypothetical protein OEV45_15615 [Desulfobacteraceae bacterium]|nr:hypothetical protein [Desulfobacteraceae bacterium]
MVQADASNNSVVNKESLKRYLNKSYQILETRLEEEQRSSDSDDEPKSGSANRKYISTTDPDASVTHRGKGKSKLQYQVQRGVDEKCEIITATEVTPGEVHEAHRMQSLIDSQKKISDKKFKLLWPTASMVPSKIIWPAKTKELMRILVPYNRLKKIPVLKKESSPKKPLAMML